MVKIGYKVVKVGPKGVWRPYIKPRPNYQVDTWASRPVGQGPLAVFNTLAAAQWFKTFGLQREMAVFRVVYQPSKDTAIWMRPNSAYGRVELDQLPLGTRLADRVMLLERVEEACSR